MTRGRRRSNAHGRDPPATYCLNDARKRGSAGYQATTPGVGQGAAQAIEDAVVLALASPVGCRLRNTIVARLPQSALRRQLEPIVRYEL